MPDAPPVLFTGFEPFLTHATNPSWAVARSAAKAFGAGAEAREIGVTYEGVRAFAATRPATELVVGVGLAPRSEVNVESLARNECLGKMDNDGAMPRGRVLEDGPATLPAELAHGAFLDTLRLHCPLPVEPSTDAGGYVCNAYLLHLLDEHTRGGPAALFVHVPDLDAAAARSVGAALAQAAKALLASRASP